jgi:hypothetical protein
MLIFNAAQFYWLRTVHAHDLYRKPWYWQNNSSMHHWAGSQKEGLLKKGNLIEVSRHDLVGLYVGWTASLTE